MSLGMIMLIHKGLARATQVARHWAGAGCPVVLHVDARVDETEFARLKSSLRDLTNVAFGVRTRCEWGTWSIVQATLRSTEVLLARFPEVQHVYLVSGACMPLRPVPELVSFLRANHDTDFIESVTTMDVPWTAGGLQHERFSLYFPVGWKRRRALFDRLVDLQRRLGVRRTMPLDLEPHIGSQWWCLTRSTLEAILNDPERDRIERFFRHVWIPDESYFQTVVRRHSSTIESRSLTLAKFDYQGRPHVFYDDHLELLRRSDCFVARKIWHKADRLYQSFLAQGPQLHKDVEPRPSKIDRLFSQASERRTNGRAGLIMQSRFPGYHTETRRTAAPYSVFQGFDAVFEEFRPWLSRAVEGKIHGRLFHPDGAEFTGDQKVYQGGISRSPVLRDYNPEAFLTNLTRSGASERQLFQFAPGDDHRIWDFMVYDPNAQISIITGAWTVPLLALDLPFEEARIMAARLQVQEQAQVNVARSRWAKATIRIWSLSRFLDVPLEALQAILDDVPTQTRRLIADPPKFSDLSELPGFLQALRNQGMEPYLAGDIHETPDPSEIGVRQSKPYLVQ
ncbi:MAG: beta-1,6-N-acetylglucosaminyltransferase [Pseudomonadota bacterium]